MLSVPKLSQGLLSTLSVVGVGKVNSCRAHLVELLTFARDGVGELDDVHDFGAAETGDLHSAHVPQVRALSDAG
jgi:hypothetical protein